MFKNILAAVAALTSASAFAIAASAPAVAASGAVLATAAEIGILASIGGFIAGWAFFILGALFLFGIFAEHTESSGWAIFFMILAAAVAFFTFSFSWLTLALGVVGYIVVGLLWSFWRYKRHAQKVVEANKNSNASEKESALRRLHPKAMLGTITAWIVIWPFSMVENVVGDIINFIQELVTKFFRGVYHRIYDSAVSALK